MPQRWFQKHFFPDWIVPSLEALDFERLAAEGYKIAYLDIDNTLVFHGAHVGDDFARQTIQRVADAGILPVIASNAREPRARSFAASLDIPYVAEARKPSTKALLADLKERGIAPVDALMLGDQLLTDVWSGKRCGMAVVLTERRGKREICTVRLKRGIEWLIIRLGGLGHWKRRYETDASTLRARGEARARRTCG